MIAQTIPEVARQERRGVTASRGAVEVIRDVDVLLRRRSEWEHLASNALAPNVFFEPHLLVPALRHLAGQDKVEFALVYVTTKSGRQLVGFCPFQRLERFHGLPIREVRIWKHLHCFLCTPLVHRDYASLCIAAYVRWMTESEPPSIWELPWITADSPRNGFVRKQDAHRLRYYLVSRHERPVLAPRAQGLETTETPSRGQLKDIRRCRRRLEEKGVVAIRTLDQADDPLPWIERFVQLEQSGWKGEAGTALAQRPNELAFFREACLAAAARDSLRIIELRVNDVAIASQVYLLSGTGVFNLKIAHNNGYAAYRPGVQLDLEATRIFGGAGSPAWVDSCSDPGNEQLGKIWTGRRSIDTWLMSRRGLSGPSVVLAVAPFVRKLRDYLRSRSSQARALDCTVLMALLDSVSLYA